MPTPRHPVLLAFVATVCLAAPARAQSDDASGVGREVQVEVELEGLEGELRDNVEAVVGLILQEGEDLAPSRARALYRRAEEEVRLALQPFGRYSPVIETELVDEGDDWTVRLVVDPGPATLVERVDFAVTGPGASDSGFVALADSFPVHEGDTLRHAAYETAKAGFSRYATNKGYFDAHFDTAQILVDRDAATAEVLFRFETGERARFGPITVEQDVVDPAYVDGYVVAEEGEPFDADLLRASQVGLTTGPWFGRADIQLDREHAVDGAVPVNFELTPARPQRYEIAAGYGTDTGARGSVRAQFRRINRKAHNAEGEVRLSQVEKSIAGRYNIPRPFPSDAVWGIYASFGDVSPDWSSTLAGTVGGSYSHSRGPVRETFSLEWEKSSYEAALIEGNATLVVAQADWDWIRADDRTLPTHGHRVALTLAGAHDALLSTATFGTVHLGAKLIRPLGSRLRVIARGEVGQIFTDDLLDLPPTRRFITGGDNTVRGYAFESLAPSVGDSLLVGGEALATAGLEADVEVIRNWRLAIFGDAGNAAESFGDLTFEYSVGTGVRWVSPIGMVRLDFAFPISDPDRTLRLHFILGPDL